MKPTPEQIAKLPKWAQEYISDAKLDAAIASAFHRTEPVERDVLPPKELDSLSLGWNFIGSIEYGRVEKACSNGVSHGTGWEKVSSQGTLRLFSTKILALKAMRHSVECYCARKLAEIDIQIEAESAENSPIDKPKD